MGDKQKRILTTIAGWYRDQLQGRPANDLCRADLDAFEAALQHPDRSAIGGQR